MNAPRSLAAIVRPTPTCAPSLNLPTPGGLDGTPFTPTERLGWGMLTEVLACDGPDGEEVALKVVRPGCLDPREATTRLLQEAEILGRIAHPSVVALRSVGQTQDGRAYLVMPRLYGETALERLRRKGAPQSLLCDLELAKRGKWLGSRQQSEGLQPGDFAHGKEYPCRSPRRPMGLDARRRGPGFRDHRHAIRGDRAGSTRRAA